jgi:hypothetical protein
LFCALAFLISSFGFGQVTENYQMQTGNFNANFTEKNNAPPFAGTFDNGGAEIGQFANSGSFGNTPGAAVFRTFTINGADETTTVRPLEVGDEFTITAFSSANPSSGGRMGISFRNTTTYTNFFSSTDANTVARFQIDDGGGWKSVYRVESPEDLWAKHGETENLVMMLQEEIIFTEYFRCYALGTDQVHIMQYEPRNPHHLRYVLDGDPVDPKILDLVEKYCIKLNKALGYDFNTVEFAIRDGVPYAIDFCNPAPDADINSVGQDNFDWIVENSADMAIAKAKQYKKGKMNLTWGTFVKDQILAPKAPAKKTPVKKAAVKKAPVKKAVVKKGRSLE